MKFVFSLTETTKTAYHLFMRKEAKIKLFQKTAHFCFKFDLICLFIRSIKHRLEFCTQFWFA